jgi:hypothetical protein
MEDIKSFWISDNHLTVERSFSKNGFDTFDPANNYIGIRLQQGVPLLDRDWNELEDIRRYQEMRFREKYIGNGTVDDGFRIGIDNVTRVLTVSEGSYLVGGYEVENKRTKDGKLTYQENGRVGNVLAANEEFLIYIHAWIEEVDGPGNINDDTGNKDVGVETTKRHVVKWKIESIKKDDPNKPIDTMYDKYVIIAENRKDENKYEFIDLRSSPGYKYVCTYSIDQIKKHSEEDIILTDKLIYNSFKKILIRVLNYPIMYSWKEIYSLTKDGVLHNFAFKNHSDTDYKNVKCDIYLSN